MSKITFERSLTNEDIDEIDRKLDETLFEEVEYALSDIAKALSRPPNNKVESFVIRWVDDKMSVEVKQVLTKEYSNLSDAYDFLKKQYGKDLLRVDFEQV